MKYLSRTLMAAFCISLSLQAAATDLQVNGQGSTFLIHFDTGYTANRASAIQAAARYWADRISSPVVIEVDLDFVNLTCTQSSAILGSAGSDFVFRDFTNAPQSGTFYPQALANRFAGYDLNTGHSDISARFNAQLDDPAKDSSCLGGTDWYYGTDSAPSGTISFYDTVLHELGHGLGFQTYANLGSDGSLFNGYPDHFLRFLQDRSTGTLLVNMTNAQRRAAATDNGDLVWSGSAVSAIVNNVLSSGIQGGEARMYAPASFENGSSVSHFDTSLSPDELMEPVATPTSQSLLTEALFEDIGWQLVDAVPVITGQTALAMDEDSTLTLDLSNLTVNDSDSNYPTDFTLHVQSGTNYTVSGNSIRPATNFNGQLSVPVTVDDGRNTSAPYTLSVTVNPVNDSPHISGSPAPEVLEGAEYRFTPTLSDIDSNNLTVTASNLPGWLNLDSTTGTLSGIPAVGNAGSYADITLKVSDGSLAAFLTFDLTVIADTDTDGVPDSLDDDDDGDGLKDEYEILNGLDPKDASDASADSDGDGFTNLEEYQAGTDPFMADVPPTITSPETLDIMATGYWTPAPELTPPAASDYEDGELTPTATALDDALRPGSYSVTWSVTDRAGHEVKAEQAINVHPLISLSGPAIVAEGSSVTVHFALNGPAPSYPLTVNYSLDGTTNSADYDLAAGQVTFSEGSEQESLTFNVVDENRIEGEETLTISLSGEGNFASADSVTMTVTEQNIAPDARPSIEQDGKEMRVLSATGGIAKFKAQALDPNVGDQLSYEWTFPGDAVVTDTTSAIALLDVSSLDSGLYEASVLVRDDGNPVLETEKSVRFRVMPVRPTLGAGHDTDRDGIDDASEGWGDTDNDGLPDFMDKPRPSHVLPESVGDFGGFVLESEPGVRLGLGTEALRGGDSVLLDQESAYESAQLSEDLDYELKGGIFDFVVEDLPKAGESVRIVLPQRALIPANGVYRKFMRGRWYDFVEDGNNAISSAPGRLGSCPAPGHDSYRPGLHEGDACIQLLIEDGGPNDSDRKVNGAIVDPGGVAVRKPQESAAVAPTADNTSDQSTTSGTVSTTTSSSGSSGGGGGGSAGWMLLLALLLVGRICRRQVPG
ncbi:putative Ig domain-containing protein [Marinobacteraceae bacterium S3BR75-40.1]